MPHVISGETVSGRLVQKPLDETSGLCGMCEISILCWTLGSLLMSSLALSGMFFQMCPYHGYYESFTMFRENYDLEFH